METQYYQEYADYIDFITLYFDSLDFYGLLEWLSENALDCARIVGVLAGTGKLAYRMLEKFSAL